MWTHHPDLLATPVPRYTSFPTAAEFGDGVGAADMAAQLAAIPNGSPVSLYLHVPYCREICWYCGCNTGTANRKGRLAVYVQRLHGEVELLAGRIGHRVRVSRIAWGGGSPNALDPADFVALTTRLHDSFDCTDSETSIEVDPRGFDAGWARAIVAAGARRVSLGVQTFSPAIQAAIGRVQPAPLIERTVRLLRQVGVSSINFDLMYGLPGQTDDDLADTIERTLAMAPERVAFFGYAHVPHLLPRQRQIDATVLPGAEERFHQAALGHGAFVGGGYHPVGFDHFALPGDALAVAARDGRLRRNFQGFTEDQAHVLIGMGASAISSFPGALLQNEKNAGRWQMRIASGHFATSRGLMRSPGDQRRGRAIERLLCSGHADLSGLPDLPVVRERLEPFVRRALARWTDDTITIPPEALPYARSIAATLDPHRADATRRFSSAV